MTKGMGRTDKLLLDWNEIETNKGINENKAPTPRNKNQGYTTTLSCHLLQTYQYTYIHIYMYIYTRGKNITFLHRDYYFLVQFIIIVPVMLDILHTCSGDF